MSAHTPVPGYPLPSAWLVGLGGATSQACRDFASGPPVFRYRANPMLPDVPPQGYQPVVVGGMIPCPGPAVCRSGDFPMPLWVVRESAQGRAESAAMGWGQVPERSVSAPSGPAGRLGVVVPPSLPWEASMPFAGTAAVCTYVVAASGDPTFPTASKTTQHQAVSINRQVGAWCAQHARGRATWVEADRWVPAAGEGTSNHDTSVVWEVDVPPTWVARAGH